MGEPIWEVDEVLEDIIFLNFRKIIIIIIIKIT